MLMMRMKDDDVEASMNLLMILMTTMSTVGVTKMMAVTMKISLMLLMRIVIIMMVADILMEDDA